MQVGEGSMCGAAGALAEAEESRGACLPNLWVATPQSACAASQPSEPARAASAGGGVGPGVAEVTHGAGEG